MAVVIAAVALYYTARSFVADSNSSYIQSLSTIENELTQVESLPDRIAAAGSPVRLRWETTFLNAVERLAWLVKSGKYPKEFSDYYRLDFQWARYIIENDPDPGRMRSTNYKDILEICNQKGWPARSFD